MTCVWHFISRNLLLENAAALMTSSSGFLIELYHLPI